MAKNYNIWPLFEPVTEMKKGVNGSGSAWHGKGRDTQGRRSQASMSAARLRDPQPDSSRG